jgi:AMP-binding enzyme C-terminal domain
MQPLGISASVTDVDQLAIQVTQFASRRRLTVVPVIPVSGRGWGYLVLLDQHRLTAAQFCELAVTVEAKLLYVKTDDFNARTDPGTAVGRHDIGEQSSPVSDQLIRFRQDVGHFNGRTRQLELAFVTGCIPQHPAIANVALVGLADPVVGERACAVIVPRGGVEVTLGELYDFLTSERKIAVWKVPERIEFVEDFPLTATGKIQKFALRDRCQATSGT